VPVRPDFAYFSGLSVAALEKRILWQAHRGSLGMSVSVLKGRRTRRFGYASLIAALLSLPALFRGNVPTSLRRAGAEEAAFQEFGKNLQESRRCVSIAINGCVGRSRQRRESLFAPLNARLSQP